LGANLDKGNTMYEELIKKISNSIKNCS